jgi:putative membrane-bound dehydrogenase-like protein
MLKHRLSRWTLALLLAVMGAGLILLCPSEKNAEAAEPERVPTFQVPPGFIVEKIAGPPLVEHPVMAGFDDQGRLYVAENAGVNLKAADLLKELPSSIKRLEDTDGDGIFDKAIVFADKLSFPMGVLWHDGAVYTCSPPSLWKLEDTDGDGVADKRTELVTRFNFTGNAADIHGPFLGPDGRLYWCDGRHGHEITQPDGTVMKGKAARIFRCKLDGTEVETVCGGGMDNPVEVAFTEEGEPFCTANIVVGRPRQDGILYCIEGGVYPREEFVTQLKEFKLTGDLLPMTVNLGWVAPSGLMRYFSDSFCKEYLDKLFYF